MIEFRDRANVLLLAMLLSACNGGLVDQSSNSFAPTNVPSCYLASGLHVASPVGVRDVFVFVDQTTAVNQTRREALIKSLEPTLVNGTSFTIATFSARTGNGYAQIAAKGAIESRLIGDSLNLLPKRRLERLERCLTQQVPFARNLVSRAIAKVVSVDAATFSHSEILASLADLSKTVKSSKSKERIVVIVSDLFEHSTTTSFYNKRELRKIEPKEELRRAIDQSLLGDFAGAKIYVSGAGLTSLDSQPGELRDQASLNALRQFWELWFRESVGDLREYGQPELLNPIN